MDLAFLIAAIFYVENYTTKYGKIIFSGMLLLTGVICILELCNRNVAELLLLYKVLGWGLGIYVFWDNYRKSRRNLNKENRENLSC